ncbi:MAG: penicillin-binding protein activator LpoB [Planctomycetota bacterium]|nr:MAG: penicillin-binding protein activator LpoB [Planctomycetota bacterium]
MKHMLRYSLLPLVLASGACTDRVTYEDPEGIETINEQFGGSDLLMIAQEMTQSFSNSNVWGSTKPRVVFGGVKNRTQQHVDTVNITDTIQTALIQSGKFTVLAGDQGIEEMKKETDYQQSGAVDMESAVQLGKQRGAEYVLYGRFTEIAKQEGSTKSRWMKFTLNGVNVQTREIVWADEKIISKLKEESFLGW